MKKIKIFENNIPSGTDTNINLFESVTLEQVKSEFTKMELEVFNTLVRLGDDVDLAYNTVVANRPKDDSADEVNDFYRKAYESVTSKKSKKLPVFEANMFIADEIDADISGTTFKYEEDEDAKEMMDRYARKLGIDPEDETIQSDETIDNVRVIGVNSGRALFWFFLTPSKSIVKDIITKNPDKFGNVIDLV